MEFYQRNQVIFLTGVTGFTGKTLLEKILRSLPSVRKIYVLVKVSGNKSLQSCINDDIFSTRVFDTLRAQYKNEQDFQEKVVSKVLPIQGDLSQANLGMSDLDIRIVRSDTDMVVNCATSTAFDLSLKEAININTYGVVRLVNFADGMPCLEAFVHVSTAFANMTQHVKHTKEEVYPYSLGKPRDFLSMIDSMSDEELKTYEKDIVLKIFPNTFVAAMALADDLLQVWRNKKKAPVVIVRPSMIGASISEPVPGWVEGMDAINGQIVYCGNGTVQDYVGNPNAILDIVPVDIVCKTILMAATQSEKESDGIPVFNISTSSLNPVTFKDVCDHIEQYWQQATIKNIQRATDHVECRISSEQEFDMRFKQRYSKEIELSKDKDQVKLQSFLKFAYDYPMMWKPSLDMKSTVNSTNTLNLDKMAPTQLKSGIASKFCWSQYLHNYIKGCHEYIMNDQVDSNQTIIYTSSSQSKTYKKQGNVVLQAHI